MFDKPKILIVDDEPRMCQSLKELLTSQNYELHTGNSAREAIEFLNNNSFDLILLDLCLPDMNGYHVMDHISRQSLGALVIILTGNASEESAIEALRRGAYDYLKKPFEPEKLLTTVKNALNQQKIKKDRELAQEALRESEEKYKSLANNLNVGIYRNTAGPNGIFIEANPAIVKMFGFDNREEFLKLRVSDLYKNPHKRKEYNAKILKEGAIRNEELELQKKDGTSFIGSVSAVVVKDEKREVKYYDGIIEDITERKLIEVALRESDEKLVRSKKMESLGLLAGGVAHDLNNILSGIVSYPELILIDLPKNSKLRKPIETMQKSGHRATAIVQDLLTVARGVATTQKPLSLNYLISDYLNSPEFKKLEQFHPTVTIKTNLDSDLFNVNGSHVHIRKVVMNLVSNASEAIEGCGNVTISTMNHYVDRPLRGYDDVKIGEYAVLSVSDDGSGISSHDLEKIFEPFYTKKAMGRSGTGLGLAVVWNVVQDHKGYIDTTTDENGTTFELYFPITRDEISDKDSTIPVKDYKGNGETILVVDDVESQREISAKILELLGYKTKVVSSGEEAVEYLTGNAVNLLLLDMIMDPGMNGHETYERIIKIHPNQKAVIASGFAETDEVRKAQRLGAGRYVKKPFTLEKIGLAVKEELEK
jgi:PAS domain S-box-containing protein